MQTISKDGMSYFISDQGNGIIFLEAWEFPNAAQAIADMISKGYSIINSGNIPTFPSKSGNSYRVFFNKPEGLVDEDLVENYPVVSDTSEMDVEAELAKGFEDELQLAKDLTENLEEDDSSVDEDVDYSTVDFAKAEKLTKTNLLDYAKTFDIELDPESKKKDLLVDLRNAVEALTK
jgi:hypothetical protein